MSIKNAKNEYKYQYIYGLYDPETYMLRYIGISVRPLQRYTNHCNEKKGTWRTNWIHSLKSKGLKPLLFILKRYSIPCDWEIIEKEWIRIAREKGLPLTNCTDGGDGIININPESKKKMSEWQIGRKLTDEHKKKIGDSSRLRRHDEKWKKTMSEKMKGRKIEWIDKIAISNRKLSNDDILDIRFRLSRHESQYAIADLYHVHQGTISNIKRGISYSDIKED